MDPDREYPLSEPVVEGDGGSTLLGVRVDPEGRRSRSTILAGPSESLGCESNTGGVYEWVGSGVGKFLVPGCGV